MATHKWLTDYAAQIGNIREDNKATELSYREPIQAMLREAAKAFGADVGILHEPGRTKDLGSPDFRVSSKGGGIVGYVECKTPGADLQKLTTKAQVQKYRALSENILLTDAFRWLHLRDGNAVADVRLSDKREHEAASDMLRAFFSADAAKIGDSKQLAAALAKRCAMLRKGLARHESDGDQSRLNKLLDEFRKALDRDLDFPRFADIFAQTVVYSLLMAKLNSPAGDKLTLATVRGRIAENFAVIRDITTFLTHLEDSGYEDIRWIVDDILAIVNEMDGAAVAESMSYKKGVSDGDDPYLNFYEIFLAEYDAKLRENRGVYYTPPPVVKFIVRAADDLLKRDFNIPAGFAAQDKVTALDFAAGTGTFMLEMARLILDGKDKAKRDMLVRGHFLQNFYGFELMASAYVISHLKLSRFLADNDVSLRDDERIKVYLTNTLEQIGAQIELTMLPKLADEARHAQKIKDKPVLVIVGNPPYSGISQNKGDWITGLIETYKHVDGKHFGERKHWLQDDYVKFVRFAQWKMEQVERGVVAVITNHAFLDNPTFRGMRQSLMNTFDSLYFLDLHGNSHKKESPPQGGRDENVFDIQQGVAVSLLVKNPAAKTKGVFHADLWGTRGEKYKSCQSGGIDSVKWRKVHPVSPGYYFIPRDNKAEAAYRSFYSVSEIFSDNVSGIVTARDHFATDINRDALLDRMRAFINPDKSDDEVAQELGLKKTRGWRVGEARKEMAQIDLPAHVQKIAYRPFDGRYMLYHSSAADWGREKFMCHMLSGDNLGLATHKREEIQGGWAHALVTDAIVEHGALSSKTTNYLFPLYRYDNGMGEIERNENLTREFRDWIDARYGEAHKAEDIFGCIYAALHSPDYRKRYADFLRTDFPRIPFPEKNAEFKRLAVIGGELIAAHLLRDNCAGKYGELRGDGTSHKVEKVRYDENAGRLYFNKAEYFAPLPPEVFNFQIGAYKPLDRFLKSRKGRVLSPHEINTMEKAANAIAFTIKKMGEIDG